MTLYAVTRCHNTRVNNLRLYRLEELESYTLDTRLKEKQNTKPPVRKQNYTLQIFS
jgi:hypothetical protein